MLRKAVNQLVVVLLSVALVTALVVRSVQADNTGVAAVMSMDMPMHGKCNGCAGQEKSITPTACFAFCSTVAVVSLRPAAYNPTPAETLAPSNALAAIGLAAAPDPYPPRPASIS